MYDFDEYEDTSFIHDEDSFNPNSICDEEPERDEDEERATEIVNDTMDALESAIKNATGSITMHGRVPLNHLKMALQLLKAYSCQYQIDLDSIYYNYD